MKARRRKWKLQEKQGEPASASSVLWEKTAPPPSKEERLCREPREETLRTTEAALGTLRVKAGFSETSRKG